MAKTLTLPDKIRISSLDWTIKLDPLYCKANQICGESNMMRQVITLDPTLSHEMIMVTLMHEIMHVICWQYSLREVIDHKTEELVVNSISNGFYAAIKDNNLKF